MKIGVLTFFLCIGGSAIWRKIMHRERILDKALVAKVVCLSVFSSYLYMVIAITLLSRVEAYTSIVNLRLFSTFGFSLSEQMLVYENIMLFIPFGVLLFMLLKPFRKWYCTLMAGVLFSLSIEMVQMMTHRGRFEVDDILTNGVGTMVGFGVCKVICHVAAKIKNNENHAL